MWINFVDMIDYTFLSGENFSFLTKFPHLGQKQLDNSNNNINALETNVSGKKTQRSFYWCQIEKQPSTNSL